MAPHSGASLSNGTDIRETGVRRCGGAPPWAGRPSGRHTIVAGSAPHRHDSSLDFPNPPPSGGAARYRSCRGRGRTGRGGAAAVLATPVRAMVIEAAGRGPVTAESADEAPGGHAPLGAYLTVRPVNGAPAHCPPLCPRITEGQRQRVADALVDVPAEAVAEALVPGSRGGRPAGSGGRRSPARTRARGRSGTGSHTRSPQAGGPGAAPTPYAGVQQSRWRMLQQPVGAPR